MCARTKQRQGTRRAGRGGNIVDKGDEGDAEGGTSVGTEPTVETETTVETPAVEETALVGPGAELVGTLAIPAAQPARVGVVLMNAGVGFEKRLASQKRESPQFFAYKGTVEKESVGFIVNGIEDIQGRDA